MKILAHRGIWSNDKTKQNSYEAVLDSFENGFGVEIDIRDHNGEIVVAHDFPTDKNVRLVDLLKKLEKCGQLFRQNVWAVNIKADGLEQKIEEILKDYHLINNSFVFDMSLPSLVNFVKNKSTIPLCTRYSDVEKFAEPVMIDECSYIWVDSFYGKMPDFGHINFFLESGKHVVFVSDELHKRQEYKSYWRLIVENVSASFYDQVYICTDYPHEAKIYFETEEGLL
jgi:hypothetical protein